jgi:hypothetical protein
MNRTDLTELHYITPVENLPLIFEHGILSHTNSKRLNVQTVALEAVQKIRAKKVVPNGRRLHDYANLYICARNPMMYKRQAKKLTVVRVSADVLDLPGVVITDGNAASGYTAFWPSPLGLEKVSKDSVFAENWDDPNQIEKWQKARIKCAEVLVPDRIGLRFILGVYVPNMELREEVVKSVSGSSVDVDAHLFFKD